MTFNCSEYLNLARELAGKSTAASSEEAKLRSAISRAYYAAFIQARNLLRDRDNLTIPRDKAHKYVIEQFQNSVDDKRRKLGEKLQRLRDFRNQADYNDTFPKVAAKTEEALGLARRIILGISNL
ncbi:HEPN domain-containing protein [Aerosakkonema funiforme]|uniref:HEPN domain-containing protein n=1 Tax=Aerosakkonema funiforme TaxID=1246630 RepID=UPI0035B75F54